MNWVKYLVNQLELDCREAQDQGYEFHFSWLLILIAFIAWEMPKGATFPDIEPFEPLAAKFSTLWYSNDMNKQWYSNVVFHTYYNQLKLAIQSKPCMTPNTLHRFRPLMKFNADRHFIISQRASDEIQETAAVILQVDRGRHRRDHQGMVSGPPHSKNPTAISI
jgi:hypothetical protein